VVERLWEQAEVAQPLERLFSRGGQARGIFISYSGFTDPAVATCRDAIAGGALVVLSTLQEIVELLEREGDVKAWLKAKITVAVADKIPFFTVPA
jgi:restriction system protein